MALVVALAGKIGSGKTALSMAVSQALGWRRVSFGDYVREVVSARGLGLTRENLQTIGTEVLEADTQAFCKAVLRHAGWTPGESLVIDGLRHSETVPVIRQLVSPARFLIVYLDIDEDSRIQRLGLREDAQVSLLSKADAHSSEQQVTTVLSEMADYTVDSRKELAECTASVLEWIKGQ